MKIATPSLPLLKTLLVAFAMEFENSTSKCHPFRRRVFKYVGFKITIKYHQNRYKDVIKQCAKSNKYCIHCISNIIHNKICERGAEYAHRFPACRMRRLKGCHDGNAYTALEYANILCNLCILG